MERPKDVTEAYRKMVLMDARIKKLELWIDKAGNDNYICTEDILDKVCAGCGCDHKET